MKSGKFLAHARVASPKYSDLNVILTARVFDLASVHVMDHRRLFKEDIEHLESIFIIILVVHNIERIT